MRIVSFCSGGRLACNGSANDRSQGKGCRWKPIIAVPAISGFWGARAAITPIVGMSTPPLKPMMPVVSTMLHLDYIFGRLPQCRLRRDPGESRAGRDWQGKRKKAARGKKRYGYFSHSLSSKGRKFIPFVANKSETRPVCLDRFTLRVSPILAIHRELHPAMLKLNGTCGWGPHARNISIMSVLTRRMGRLCCVTTEALGCVTTEALERGSRRCKESGAVGRDPGAIDREVGSPAWSSGDSCNHYEHAVPSHPLTRLS